MQAREKYFLYLLLAACLILTFFVFLPFLIPLALGIAFAVLLAPWYQALLVKTGNRANLSAFLTVAAFICIIVVPLAGIGILGYQEAQSMFSGDSPVLAPNISNALVSLQKQLPALAGINIDEYVQNALGFLAGNVGAVFSATFSTLLSFFLMVLSLFFFLRDGDHWRTAVIKVSPLSGDRNRLILDEMQKSIRGIIQGYLLIALIQGILMGIGLFVFDVPHAVLWGILAGIAALIPVIGTMAVSIPVAMYLYIVGGIVPALGFMAWAGVLVGMVDNVLNPIIVGRKVNIHPLMILLSVLGGVSFFGPAGILLGPLLASLLYTLIIMYRKDFE